MKIISRSLNGGTQDIHRFPNGYGASVVQGPYSYGGDQGLYELAVIQFTDGDKYELCYSTHITNDVLGYLTEDEVSNALALIEELSGD